MSGLGHAVAGMRQRSGAGRAHTAPIDWIDDLVLIAGDTAWTWVEIPTVSYELRTNSERLQLASSLAHTLQRVDDTDLHLKVVCDSPPVAAWARRLWQLTSAANPPAPGFADYLREQQESVFDEALTVRRVFLGIALPDPTGGAGITGALDGIKRAIDKVAAGIAGQPTPDHNIPHPETLAALHASAEETRLRLAHSPLRAVDVDATTLAWLIRTSSSPGLSGPRTAWAPGADGLSELFDVTVDNHPRRLAVTDNSGRTSHTAELVVSRFPREMVVPDSEPWLFFAAALPWHVDVSVRMRIVPPHRAAKDALKRTEAAADQAQHLHEAQVSVGYELREQLDTAQALHFAITRDGRHLAYYSPRLQISAPTAEELADRVRRTQDHYAGLGITLLAPAGDQLGLWREQIPGDPTRVRAYQRTADVITLAAGLPHATAHVGDGEGPIVAHTSSRVRTIVNFDAFSAPRNDDSSGVIVTGKPGSGKALALTTPIPTPAGWTTMGDLAVGDVIFDEQGQPTTVTGVYDQPDGRPCFEVVFDDGEVIVADEEHRWYTETRPSRQSLWFDDNRTCARRPAGSPEQIGTVAALLEQTAEGELTTIGALVARTRVYNPILKGAETLTPVDHQGLRGAPQYDTRALLHVALARLTAPLNDQRHRRPRAGVRTTGEIRQTLRIYGDQRLNHSIPLAKPLATPTADLLIDPYLLGAWLGDGTASKGTFTTADDEIALAFSSVYETRKRPHGNTGRAETYSALGLQAQLRSVGVLSNKHIPDAYLRADSDQRLALLQGLVDTDGHVNTHGRVEITLADERLARDTHELIISLGMRAGLRCNASGRTLDNGTRKPGKDRWRITFTPSDLKVARLARKASRLRPRDAIGLTRRFIADVRPVDSAPVRCITVDSPNSLFLAGRHMVPTHNTSLALLLAYQQGMRGATQIIIDPKGDFRPLEVTPGMGPVRVLQLSSASDGLLDPFTLASDPREARLLALDVIRKVLGPGTAMREDLVLSALNAVADGPNPSLGALVDMLKTGGALDPGLGADMRDELAAQSRMLGNHLGFLAELPLARLCFSAGTGEPLQVEGVTTIITLAGLDLPSAGTPEVEYSHSQRLAVTLLYLVCHLARQVMRALPRQPLKSVIIDEAWAVTATAEGRALVPELARMGRSRNLALLLISQNARDMLDEQVRNSATTVFGFRATDAVETSAVCGLLGISDTPEHQATIAGLPTGSAIMRDRFGRAARISVQLPLDDDIRRLWDTNPTRNADTSTLLSSQASAPAPSAAGLA